MLLLEGEVASDYADTALDVVQDAVKYDFLKEYFSDFPTKALALGIRIALAIVLFVVGIFVIKLIRKIVRSAMNKAKADAGVVGFVDSFIKAALFIVLIFLLASNFGFDAAGIVALLGSAGVAIGLAIQGSLSNLAGGVLILILKPFKVGDYIKDNGTGKEGTVTDIHIFYTKLKTVDNQVVILPNGNLSNNAITNVTAENIRRIDIMVSIAYSASIDKAREVILATMDSEEMIIQNKEKKVLVDKLMDSGVNLDVRFWVKAKDYWDAYYGMNEAVKKALDEAKVEIPFPQLDVHMK